MKEAQSTRVPLCLDLEWTLVRINPSSESIVTLILRRPWYLPLVLIWALRGLRHLRNAVATRVAFDPSALPYQRELLAYLNAERDGGRRIVLLTSTFRDYADQIASHLGISSVIANDTPAPWTAQQKAEALSKQFGVRGFDFVGRSEEDLPVWAVANEALTTDGSKALAARIAESTKVSHTFEGKLPNPLLGCLLALRPHQWLKNFLIFVPPLAAHRFLEQKTLLAALLAFVAFCCAASAGYILNDLMDLASDRRHSRKWRRPFASGAIAVQTGLLLGLILLCLALAIAFTLRSGFLLCLLLYLVGTIAYSSWLKRKAIVDVLTLAGLYTLRILSGSAATNIPPSFWLLALSMFFFMDLACVKRYVELHGTKLEDNSMVPGRGYGSVDRETLFTIGTTAGLTAVLVLALYINNTSTMTLYPNPELLWGLCPLLLYWTSRIWILSRRGLLHDDPLVFAVRDRISLITFGCAALLLWIGSLPHMQLTKLFFS